MVYQVPASKASLKQNRFEFQIPGSKKIYSVPLLKFLKPALAFRIESATEVEAASALFDEYLPEALEKFEDGEQLGAFMQAWAEASGVTVGESKASADS